MTTCSTCGKPLHTGSIHTCSPQVVEDFPDARLPDVPAPAPSGWLTMTKWEARAASTYVAEPFIARWRVEAVAQRDRAVAAEAMVAGRDSQMAALRQLAEQAIEAWAQTDHQVRHHRHRTELRDRLAENGGAS